MPDLPDKLASAKEGEAPGLLRAIQYHEDRELHYRRDRDRIRRWSAKNNDGDETLGGTYSEDEIPLLIREHQKSARALRTLLRAIQKGNGHEPC